MRKHALFVALIAVILFWFGSTNVSAADSKRSSMKLMFDSTHCPGGNGHPNENGPVICIDAKSLNANPDKQRVHQGSWIHFYLTVANQELDIQFTHLEKIQFKNRKGNECWVRVKDDAGLGEERYTAINLTTKKRKDPEVVIEP